MFFGRILLLLSLTLVGCFKAPSVQTLRQGEGIIGGSPVVDSDLAASSTVGLYDNVEMGSCTGTLIAPNIVLTAAHCLTSRPKNIRIIFHKNLDEIINAREPDIKDLYTRRAADYKVHELYNPEEEREYDVYDIGLVRFSGDLPAGYKPVDWLKNPSVFHLGMFLTVAGYGATKVNARQIDPRYYPDLEEAMKYGEVICFEKNDCIEVETEGDSTLMQAQAKIRTLHKTEVSLDETAGQGTCSGDSGGPAYIKIGDRFLVAGVTSRGSILCDDEGVYTSTAAHSDWIQKNLDILKNKANAKY